MAPAATHAQHPSSFVFPTPCENPEVSMSKWPVPMSSMILPRIHPHKKGVDSDWPERMRMFHVFHKAFRHLRGVLFRILSRCAAAVRALRPQVSSPPVGMAVAMGMPADMAGLAFGVMGGWMWTPVLTQDGEGLQYAPNEKMLEGDEIMETPGEKTSEAWEPEGGEIDLEEWLEWDTCEDCSEEKDILTEEPVPGHTGSHSGGHLEWDSDSSWSDDDDDDDWDEASDEDSEENSELWESFSNNDPYNPFHFKCPPVVKDTCNKAPEGCVVKPLQLNKAEIKHACEEEEEQQRLALDGTPSTGHTKVRFGDDVKVHHLVAWAFANRAARDGSCWQQMARDRARFRRRVEAAGDIIEPCLVPQHRARVWDMLHLE